MVQIAGNLGETVQPANLLLQTAVRVREADTNNIRRYEALYVMPQPVAAVLPPSSDAPNGMPIFRKTGTAPAVIRHDDVKAWTLSFYRGAHLLSTITNEAQCLQESQYYLLAAAAKYEVTNAQDREYNGIRSDIVCDGAIQQISWHVGGEGASTSASRNSEHDLFVPNYPDRRKLELLGLIQNQQGANKLGAEKPAALKPELKT